MIGRLKGILIHKSPPWLVIDVQGVGYELEAPMSTFYDLPELGREVFLFTHYAVKEDSVALYGFMRENDRRLFREVQSIEDRALIEYRRSRGVQVFRETVIEDTSSEGNDMPHTVSNRESDTGEKFISTFRKKES